jgi:hypothetical protein
MTSTTVHGPFASGLAGPPSAPGRSRIDAFAAGLAGHERVERDALRAAVGGDERVLRAIYFGNWQRDYSQFIPEWFGELGPRLGPFLGRVMFDVLDVMAQSEFGQRLHPVRFGTYRWEEHIDNPRGFGLALDPAGYRTISRRRPVDEPNAHPDLWREDDRGMLRYFQLSRDYAVGRLGAALASRRGLRGYEHLGAALHTVEDLFAHSNFAEIAILALGGRAEPMTGTIAATGEPIRDRLGRYRLTTGVFLRKDSISSISKLLLAHVEGVPSMPAAASITEVLVGRFLGPTAQALYRRLVPRHSAQPPGWLTQAVEERLLAPLRRAIADALHPALERYARQTGRERYQGFVHGRPVVIVGSWRAGMTDVHRTGLPGLVAKYINHPQADPSWWTPTVRPALAAAERPVLRRGSQGERVRFLQRLLNDWLAIPPGRAPLALDGIFGPRTQAAVVAFQRRNGLPADGIVGSRTWNALQAPRLPGRH